MGKCYSVEPPLLRISDAISPEELVNELASRNITVAADFLRQRAIELGACHMLGQAMLLLPVDVDMILRDGKQKPTSPASEPASTDLPPPAHSSKESRKPILPDQDIQATVYTPPMLAKRWGCSERHIRNLINEGKLGCFRLGGKLVRIKHSDVEAAEKVFAQDALVLGEPRLPPRDPANELVTRARVNSLRAKRLDR